jgi:hypothetical protein
MDNNLNVLSTRKGFNTALKHFKFVNKLIKKIGQKENLADLINEALEEKQVAQHQFAVILNALLIDKFGYYCESYNIKTAYTSNLSGIADMVSDWNKIDIVLTYFHPQLGQILINPKNESHWESVNQLKENELVVIYVGNFSDEIDLELSKKTVIAIKSILSGEKVTNTKNFRTDDIEVSKPVQTPKKEAVKLSSEVKKEVINVKPTEKTPISPGVGTPPPPPSSTAKKKLSPHYGVIVSNELFHNGNVEAWKKIIASYELKYPDNKVLVFYEGEQIQDINTLFKWGKVKHGTNIYFALLGAEFTDISKLRRYLAQGASNRFEDFLRGDPTKTLSLF